MNNHNGPGFMAGFMWGIILGGGAAFLLGTKRGKNILKALSEGGLELSEFLEEIEEEPEEKTQEYNPETNGNKSEKTSTVRRFFRGIPKKAS